MRTNRHVFVRLLVTPLSLAAVLSVSGDPATVSATVSAAVATPAPTGVDQIAYASASTYFGQQPHASLIGVVGLDGSGAHTLPIQEPAAEPAWNPAGTLVAFTATYPDGGAGVKVFDPATGQERAITPEGFQTPVWSPDGTRIAVTSSLFLSQDVAVVAATGGTPKTVMDQRDLSFSETGRPAWSPDGSRIAAALTWYEEGDHGSTMVATVAVDGTGYQQAAVNSNGNNGATGYEYDLQLNAQSGDNANPASASANVTAIAMDQKSCNRLVQKSFPLAQCFVYQNADGNHHSGAVLFELTCPNFDGSTTSNCGDTSLNNFAAALGTSFTFVKSQNPFFQLLNLTIGPYPGWLKGDGGASGHPCVPPSTGALFQSNQITSFSVVGDPLGTTKGKSGGGGSCWVATYFTAGEQPSAITITSPTSTTYARNAVVTASYTCSTPATSKDASSPTATVGPYLTAASCTQSQAPNNNTTASCSASTFAGGISCQNGVVDTSSPGQHVFVVTSKDSGGNVNAKIVGYKVSK